MFRPNYRPQLLMLTAALALAGIDQACSTTITPPEASATGGTGGSGSTGSKSTKPSHSGGGKGGSSSSSGAAGSPISDDIGDLPGDGGMSGTPDDSDASGATGGSDAVSGDAGAPPADDGSPSSNGGMPSDGSGGTSTSSGSGGTGDAPSSGDGDGDSAAGASGSEPPPPDMDDAVARGLALTKATSCTTCHQLDYSGYAIYPNLTPDVDTGIGAWTDDEVKAAILHGEGRGGSTLCQIMVRFPFSDEQASDVVAFLRSLPPISNSVDEVCPGHIE